MAGMKTEEVIRYFGNKTKVAKSLGIARQALQFWGEEVPYLRACQIELITKGKLKAPKVPPKHNQQIQ